MIKPSILVFGMATALLVFAPSSVAYSQLPPVLACEICANPEDKEDCNQICKGSFEEDAGTDCTFGLYEGCMYCNWDVGGCHDDEEEDFAGVLVSPAGTALDMRRGSVTVYEDRVVSRCNGLVLTHVDYTDESTKNTTLITL